MAGLASTGHAQVCMGTPSFSTGSVRIGGSALISSDSKAYGAQGAIGTWKNWSISGAFAHAKLDSTDGSSNMGGGAVSYQYDMSGSTVQLCPTVGVYAQEGSLVGEVPFPNNPQNTLDVHVGGSLGWVASSSSSMEVIPAVSAAWVARSHKNKIVQQGVNNPTTTDNFGLFTGTIGFVFNKRCTISPIVTVPVSEENGKASFGVGVSYNFNPPGWLHM